MRPRDRGVRVERRAVTHFNVEIKYVGKDASGDVWEPRGTFNTLPDAIREAGKYVGECLVRIEESYGVVWRNF